MEIALLRGTINSGKTTTIALLYMELLGVAQKSHIFNHKQVDANSLSTNNKGNYYDFTSILIIGSVKIGIVSAGDIAKNLEKDIKKMISLNVDILICCARSMNRKGSSYQMLQKNYLTKYSFKEYWSKFSEDKSKKYSIKQTTIDKIRLDFNI